MNYDKYSEVIIPPEADLKLPTNNNSRYFYNNKIKELVLDVVFNTDSGNKPREFKLQLADPLIIDVEHDIFLDTVVTYNLKSSKMPQNIAFLLKIDQFNIQTKSATNIIKVDDITNRINNSIMIPNEKAHETIEHIQVDQFSTDNAGNLTINLPTFAVGHSITNYYRGYNIILQVNSASNPDNGTYTGIIDSNTNNGVLTVNSADSKKDGTPFSGSSFSVNNIQAEIFREHNNHAVIHKGRKHNYVGTITPTKLMNITGSVSDMGSLNFDGSSSTDGRIKETGEVIYGNPFHNNNTVIENIDNNNLERMIVEFKLVPRE